MRPQTGNREKKKKKRAEKLRDGPLESLWEEGGAGEIQKKSSRRVKLNEKNSCTPINPKKYSCYGLKKIHTRNLITKKILAARKLPSPPPISFLMVRPLVFSARFFFFFSLFPVCGLMFVN